MIKLFLIDISDEKKINEKVTYKSTYKNSMILAKLIKQ